jgi:hypothetical protein
MTKYKKLEVENRGLFDKDHLPEFEKLLKKKNLRMPTMDDIFWMWKQGTRFESENYPFWVKMPAGPAVPGYYYGFGDEYRFYAYLGPKYGIRGLFGGIGVRDVRVKK